MARDFYPRKQALILAWTANFSSRINSDPRYGVSPERAAEFAGLQAEFATAYALAAAPGTNSQTATARKDAAALAMERSVRLICGMLRGRMDVTAAMRMELGMNPRKGGGHSPRIQMPDEPPSLRVTDVVGHTLFIQVSDRQSPATLRKPRGCNSVMLRTYVGDHPPADLKQWRFRGTSSRNRTTLNFEDQHLPPGTKVWVTAQWTIPTGQAGVGCDPVYAHLNYGVLMKPSQAA